METGSLLKVSPDKMVGLGIEPANPGLQDEWFNRVQLSSSFWQNKSILSIPVVLGGGGGDVPFIHFVLVSPRGVCPRTVIVTYSHDLNLAVKGAMFKQKQQQ